MSAAAGVEAVAAALQRDCPAYFKEEDRIFYQVGWWAVPGWAGPPHMAAGAPHGSRPTHMVAGGQHPGCGLGACQTTCPARQDSD